MRCLLILAHPRRDSLCGALFGACADGARQAGADRLARNGLHRPSAEVLAPQVQRIQCLTFILWFCVPPLIILNLAACRTVKVQVRAGPAMGEQAGQPTGDEQVLRRRIPTGKSAGDDGAGRKRCVASAE